MRKPYFAIAAIATLLAGCAAPPQMSQSRSASQTPAASAPQTVVHEYAVKAVDVGGQPIPGVAVALTMRGTHAVPPEQVVNCVTDDKGRCPVVSYTVKRDPTLRYVVSYSSLARAEGTKDGYYKKGVGTISSHGSNSGPGSQTKTEPGQELVLTMVRPIDYLEDSLATSATDRELRERVLTFLDVIRVQGVLNDAEVMLKGIGVTDFKGRKYLRVKVNSTSVFNNLKLNKYDVGKRVFDDSARKILTPLNDAIAAPRAYYGYDLTVFGHSKSFTEKYAKPDKLEYRFLMPEASVRKYKDKDISGQALLDASVVLLDDERIDLKLQ